MAEFARTFVSRLRQFVGDRREVTRHRVRLALSISIASPAKNVKGSRRTISMDGHTSDLSANGMALIVPAITLGEHHLVGENRNLNVQLELSPGPVEMQVVPVRYERLEEHAVETGYLIAVKIIGMSESDRTRYQEYVSTLQQRKR
jgi:PilZ domain-containing protein